MSIFQIKKFIKDEHICYSLEHKTPSKFNYQTVRTSTLFAFIFNPNIIKRETSFNFFFYSYDSTFHGINFNSLATQHISWITMYNISLTYKEYKSFLLPSPYDTNCYDYRPIYKSDQQCYDNCHLNLSLKIHGLIPMSVIKENRFNAMVYPGSSAQSLRMRNE